jgi:hypothetical protein
MKKQKKNPVVEDDAYRHHFDPLDYPKEEERSLEMHCPNCAKAQKHRHLVETKGKIWECPECHLLLELRRV